jgi:hypothetical protein
MVDNITNNNSTNDSFGKLKPQITEMTTNKYNRQKLRLWSTSISGRN